MPRGRKTARGRSVIAQQEWDPDLVSMVSCSPTGTLNVNSDANYQGIDAHHYWRNDNPKSDTDKTVNHAFLRVKAEVNGQPVKITANTDHPYRRQPDDETYEAMVSGGGSTHWVSFLIDAQDIPLGDNMTYGARVETLEPHSLTYW